MQIAICDESFEEREEITDCLRKYFSDKSMTFDISHFPKSTDLLYEIEDGKCFDIVFLEAQIHSASGINIARKLRNISYSGEIIISAQTDEYAVDGYEVKACGYMIKPLCSEKLYRIMDRAMEKFNDDVYCIKHRSEVIAIPLNEILYIESNNSKCIIHRRNGEKYTVYNQLGKIEKELNDPRFLRCHQSFLVNMNHISKVDKCFELINGEKVLIRQRSLKEIRNTYLKYIDVK